MNVTAERSTINVRKICVNAKETIHIGGLGNTEKATKGDSRSIKVSSRILDSKDTRVDGRPMSQINGCENVPVERRQEVASRPVRN